MQDIRDIIFKSIENQKFNALLIPERNGLLSGVKYALEEAEKIKIEIEFYRKEGNQIERDKPIAKISAFPKNMALAEERIIGTLSKFSGIATAAKKAVDFSEGKIRVVSGSWKKMPPSIKDGVRSAIVSGGAHFRITDGNMIYLDKNYIKMFGSIPKTIDAVKDFKNFTKVIQIKGKQLTVEEETRQALENGCGILMVDTGEINDVVRCLKIVDSMGMRNKVKIAFAGGIKIEEIRELAKLGIDVLCIGKEIVDAPLLDMRLDVI